MVQLRAVQVGMRRASCDMQRTTCIAVQSQMCDGQRTARDGRAEAIAQLCGPGRCDALRAARCILARWPAVRARRALHVVWCVGSARPHGSHRAPLSQPGRHVLTKSRCRIVRWKARLAHPYSDTPPWPTQAQTRALPPMQGCVVPCGTGGYRVVLAGTVVIAGADPRDQGLEPRRAAAAVRVRSTHVHSVRYQDAQDRAAQVCLLHVALLHPPCRGTVLLPVNCIGRPAARCLQVRLPLQRHPAARTPAEGNAGGRRAMPCHAVPCHAMPCRASEPLLVSTPNRPTWAKLTTVLSAIRSFLATRRNIDSSRCRALRALRCTPCQRGCALVVLRV
jgi:hypothetical protein